MARAGLSLFFIKPRLFISLKVYLKTCKMISADSCQFISNIFCNQFLAFPSFSSLGLILTARTCLSLSLNQMKAQFFSLKLIEYTLHNTRNFFKAELLSPHITTQFTLFLNALTLHYIHLMHLNALALSRCHEHSHLCIIVSVQSLSFGHLVLLLEWPAERLCQCSFWRQRYPIPLVREKQRLKARLNNYHSHDFKSRQLGVWFSARVFATQLATLGPLILCSIQCTLM